MLSMFFKYKMLSKNGYGNFLANFEKKIIPASGHTVAKLIK